MSLGFAVCLGKTKTANVWCIFSGCLRSYINEGKLNARLTRDSSAAVDADRIRSKIVTTVNHEIARLSAAPPKPPKEKQNTEPLEKWKWFRRYMDAVLMSDEMLDRRFPQVPKNTALMPSAENAGGW
jgi:hypothetical protein